MTTIEHPLANLPPHSARWLGYTDGATPLPVALGDIQFVTPWEEPNNVKGAGPLGHTAQRNRHGVRYQRVSVMFHIDARPMTAHLKSPPVRVFYRGALTVDLDEAGRVLRAEVGRFDYADAPNGKYVSVPCPSGWRRSVGYSGQSLKVHDAILLWAKGGVLLPVLGEPLRHRARYVEMYAKDNAQKAAKEQSLIEAGTFTDWDTPDRRQGTLKEMLKREQDQRDEAARALDLAARVALMGGASEEQQAAAAVAAKGAIRQAEIARMQAAGRAARAAEAAEAARVRLEADKAARALLEAAAPTLLAAAEAVAQWLEDRMLRSSALEGLNAAIRQAKGGAS
jgi:hypothetical protein